MTTPASNNRFKGVSFQPQATPSTPASGDGRLFLDTADGLLKWIDDAGVVTEVALGTISAGAVGTDSIWDAKGDLAAGTGANTASKLTVGANDTILMADSAQSTGLKWVASQTPSTQAFGDAAAEGTADTYARGDHKHAMPTQPPYAAPLLTNTAQNFNSSTTSLAATMTAPTSGDCLVALIMSTGRGANSITQTNVTWTQRYTGNGNSQYFEVWTAAVSASAGTTATAAFTGANKAEIITFVVSGASAFTAAAIVGSSATSASATILTNTCTPAAAGDYVICGYSRNGPVSSYGALNVAYTGLDIYGGQASAMVCRAQSNLSLNVWMLSSSSVAQFTAFVKVS